MKNSLTTFAHFIWHPEGQTFTIMADFQNQKHNWKLNQETIGHASGHKLSANWDFFNPRMGIIWEIGDSINVFFSCLMNESSHFFLYSYFSVPIGFPFGT